MRRKKLVIECFSVSGAQTINYAAAVARVQPVGVFVASFLDFLHDNGLLDYARVSLLGFSLGGKFLSFSLYHIRYKYHLTFLL